MSVTRLSLTLPLVILVACGCYGAKALRQPVAVDATEQNVKSLQEQQAQLSDAVKRLEASAARQEEMLHSLRADTQTRLQELNDNLQTVSNQLNDALSRRSAPASPISPSPVAQGAAPGGAPADTTGKGAEPAAPTPAQTKAIYDNAYLDLNRGNYSLALLGFRDYLSKSPNDDLADNAQYWIGECYYAQRDFRRAIEEFSKVEENYPKGDKLPAAMLKIAYCQLQLEDRADARAKLRDLIDRFPKSEEAKQARVKMKTLE